MTFHDRTTAFLHLLAGEHTDERYLEIRSRAPEGWRQEFFATNRLDALRTRVLSLGQRIDTYIGVVARTSRSGKKQAVGNSHLVWCEIDSPDAATQLATARVRPVLTVESGTPGHLHAYWQINRPLDVELLERANAALVAEFGGDPACTDASRILRIPGTLNFKHDPPQPVRLATYNLRAEPVSLEELVGELTRPEAAPPVAVRTRPIGVVSLEARDGLDRTRALKLIPAREWAQALLGVVPGRDGKIACPFHAGGRERTPSLQLYSDGSWFCYGCREGGSVIDFGARLWDLPPRGSSFSEIRDRLWAQIGRASPATEDRGSENLLARPVSGPAHSR